MIVNDLFFSNREVLEFEEGNKGFLVVNDIIALGYVQSYVDKELVFMVGLDEYIFSMDEEDIRLFSLRETEGNLAEHIENVRTYNNLYHNEDFEPTEELHNSLITVLTYCNVDVNHYKNKFGLSGIDEEIFDYKKVEEDDEDFDTATTFVLNYQMIDEFAITNSENTAEKMTYPYPVFNFNVLTTTANNPHLESICEEYTNNFIEAKDLDDDEYIVVEHDNTELYKALGLPSEEELNAYVNKYAELGFDISFGFTNIKKTGIYHAVNFQMVVLFDILENYLVNQEDLIIYLLDLYK